MTQNVPALVAIKTKNKYQFSVIVVFQRDHSGGNKELKRLHSSCRVYGSATDNIPGLTQ